jgi:hypothetical protein
MAPTRAEMAQNLAERLCWQVARRHNARVARHLYRKQVVDGVDQLGAGAVLDDFFACLQELGMGNWLGDVPGHGGPAHDRPVRPGWPALEPEDPVWHRQQACAASLAVQ